MRKSSLVLSILTTVVLTAGCEPTAKEPGYSHEVANSEDMSGHETEQVASRFDQTLKIAAKNDAPVMLTQAFIDQKVVAARSSIKVFGKALKKELVAGIKVGGAENAIDICNSKAPQIARQVSSDQGMNMRRVSLKYRNSSNEAIGWTRTVLETFESNKMSGKPVDELEHHEVVEISGEHEFRYMKAIPTAKVCLQCHGVQINDAVKNKLAEFYPNDKATGFSEGSIRGAFVVTERF